VPNAKEHSEAGTNLVILRDSLGSAAEVKPAGGSGSCGELKQLEQEFGGCGLQVVDFRANLRFDFSI
jgi:hypothetical protein